jgi:hypothetical protein
VLLKIIYLLVCPELGLFVLMFGTDLVKDAELLARVRGAASEGPADPVRAG